MKPSGHSSDVSHQRPRTLVFFFFHKVEEIKQELDNTKNEKYIWWI